MNNLPPPENPLPEDLLSTDEEAELLENWFDGFVETNHSENKNQNYAIEKGMGYCENHTCPLFLKGFFLYKEKVLRKCPQCGEQVTAVKEQGFMKGDSKTPVIEVRVEYDYEPSSKEYKRIAIVKDENWKGSYRTFTFQAPFTKTDKRALETAEILMGVTNQVDEEPFNPVTSAFGYINENHIIPNMRITELDLDKSRKEFSSDLKLLEDKLKRNLFLYSGENQEASREEVFSSFSEEESYPLEIEDLPNRNTYQEENHGSQSMARDRAANSEPRILSSYWSRGRALHLYSSRKQSGTRSDRSQGRLFPLFHLGTQLSKICRESGQRRRGGRIRKIANQLRSASRRKFTSTF